MDITPSAAAESSIAIRASTPTRALLLILLALPLLRPATARADVRLPKIFQSKMVLQRDVAATAWGWADEGERVTVSIAGQTTDAVAEHGKWTVKLKPLAAGGPFKMTVAGKNSIELSDVLVGDVWLSSGQSNMMMGLGSIDGGPQQIAASDKFPNLRLFNVEGDPTAEQPAGELAGGHWAAAGPNTTGSFSAVSYVFGRLLNEHLNVPIGMINVVAIVPAEGWVDRQTLGAQPMLAGVAKSPMASKAYNGMIAPLLPLAIKGVIYYQGEYNAGRGYEYRRLLPALIQSWRTRCGEGDFPFLIVQLPGFSEHKAEKDKRLDMPAGALAALHQPGAESAWAELREAQLLTSQHVANTGLAVTIDLGDPQDIHPKNKIPVAERLALAARKVAYGESIVGGGPIFSGLTLDKAGLVLHFQNAGAGLMAKGGPLRGFELGRADGSYVFADAIVKGDTVIVSSAQAPQPAAVRYAWANFPQCNLCNDQGLPASPFRAIVAEQAQAADAFTISLNDSSFEDATPVAPGAPVATAAPTWMLRKGAARSAAAASDGKQSLCLPLGGEASQDDIIPRAYSRYDWNSDPLERVNFRPGYAFGYSIDVAGGAGAAHPLRAYLRLCAHSTAEANEYWGGVPEVMTAGQSFVTRQVAGTMTTKFDVGGGGAGVGMLIAFLPGTDNQGQLLVDHLSPITVVRPMLGVSDATPIDLGTQPPGAPAVSTMRTISNQQARTLPNRRGEGNAVATPTILYGTANLHAGLYADNEHVRGPTDDVGAVLIGTNASSFEFVSEHRGASPRELKLLGQDGLPGLTGGPTPEHEAMQVRFIGAPNKGDYTTTLRIVTQAANSGRRSLGQSGEPAEGFYYLDIPVVAHVGH